MDVLPADDKVKLLYANSSTRLLHSGSDLNLSKDYMKILIDRIKSNPLV